MSKFIKLIILTTLLSVLCTLIYVPWKAERNYEYNNTLSKDIGYSFIWSEPRVYTENDFKPKPKTHFSNLTPEEAFADLKVPDAKSELQKKGINIYPDWVKNNIKVDYIKVAINIVIALIVNGVIFITYSLFKK